MAIDSIYQVTPRDGSYNSIPIRLEYYNEENKNGGDNNRRCHYPNQDRCRGQVSYIYVVEGGDHYRTYRSHHDPEVVLRFVRFFLTYDIV